LKNKLIGAKTLWVQNLIKYKGVPRDEEINFDGKPAGKVFL